MMVPAVLFAIAIAVAIYVLHPLFGGRPPDDIDTDIPPQPVGNATADALRDLELDWSTGKLSDGDYQRQRAQLMMEAAAGTGAARPTRMRDAES
jgi:hypothetical protein